ncbi:MAG: NAD(P)-dependent oxidoreductase [Victivallaceae bacterium]|nr:NAD(P)-dependent oxidoreductase [Victivallaceae bacterium]
MKKVLIPTKLDKFAAKMLTEKGFSVVQDAEKPLAELAAANSDAEVMIVRSEKVTPEIIDAMPKLKLVVRAGAGFNTIDIKYARKRNVDVMNTPGANSNAVAEEVVAMILAAYRFVVAGDNSTRAGNWEKKKFMGSELTGKTVGIMGLGHIGQLLVKRLSGFEVKVLGYDPFLSAELAEQLGVTLVGVEDIFAQSDIISLHIPENDETRGMINARLFGLMKPGAMLVNCARAGIINEADLRAAKAEKKIIFCNDVYPKDEAGDKPVKDIADIMLPHLGANTNEANFNAARRAAEQTIDYFEHGNTACVVNKELPDNFDPMYQKLAYVLTAIAYKYLSETQPSKIATSFYGKLNGFGKWLVAPIVAAVSGEVDPHDAADAAEFLARRGVSLVNREVDDSKKYGNAMTIDLFAGQNEIRTCSVRGTTAENHLMISRIGNFEHIYLEPTGNMLFVEYEDAPGVIGKIAGLLGEKNINIVDIRAPQNMNGTKALAIFKTNMAVPQLIVDKIKEAVKASIAFTLSYNA